MGEQTTVWRMHAHDRHGTFYDLGARPWVELHGLPYPIVEVDVRLVADDDHAATHWGWLKNGARNNSHEQLLRRR